MWQQPAEPFLHGGLGLLPLATLWQVADDDAQLVDAMTEVIHEIDRRLMGEAPYAVGSRLMTAAQILAGMRF